MIIKKLLLPKMDLINLGLFGLFIGTFLSATLLPFPSDLLLIGVYEGGFPIIPSLITATIGNFLGGITNYVIGYKGHTDKLVTMFKLNEQKLDKWEHKLNRWGIWLGLFSWVPFVGDPMVAALGFFRVKFVPLSILMLIGKFLRYLILTFFFVEGLDIYLP